MKKYENLSKAFYDIGKLSFATLILGQFISNKFNVFVTIIGITFTVLAFVIGVTLERIKED